MTFRRETDDDDDVTPVGVCVCCGHKGAMGARLWDKNGENPITMCHRCYSQTEDTDEVYDASYIDDWAREILESGEGDSVDLVTVLRFVHDVLNELDVTEGIEPGSKAERVIESLQIRAAELGAKTEKDVL